MSANAVAVILLLTVCSLEAACPPLDPKGRAHIPIGLPNTHDPLKTFVEAEGNFSPGFGSYGIYFWVWSDAQQRLFAPTMDAVPCEHGLALGGALVPWARWHAGTTEVKTEVCQVQRNAPEGELMVVGARATLANKSNTAAPLTFYVAVRPLGAAGWSITNMGCSQTGDTLAVQGFPAIVAQALPTHIGGQPADTIGAVAMTNGVPAHKHPQSPQGDCSGALRYELELKPGETRSFGFICPVLPMRRVAGHRWDGNSTWAQFDEAPPNPSAGGVLQPYPGLAFYRKLKADQLIEEAIAYWRRFTGQVTLQLPDPRWSEGFAAILSHTALCMNEGAPDVAVINYNVFNRDGVYMANIFQKAGQFALAEQAIDYFLKHPFNGRVQPEADNPGQVLWIMGEHWKFTRDPLWLDRVYPAAAKLAAMVRYYRTTPGPHWVWDTSLDFGEALPTHQRKELKPGACDGYHPEYTEAFDIAGLRAAAALAEAAGKTADAAGWQKLADDLFKQYDQRFGSRLAKDYGSYSVLWPCRLYPFESGKACEQFRAVGAQKPTSWRYFPLATAHQGLLAGNRAAAWETLQLHLDHPQMRGWYACDEGGVSGVGGWNHVRATWPQGKASVAMPHGWAIAEVILLLRDSLLFEDGDELVLLAGVSPDWFHSGIPIRLAKLPTHFGQCTLEYTPRSGGATLRVSGANPPRGYRLRLPASIKAAARIDGKALPQSLRGDFHLPASFGNVELQFSESLGQN